MRALLLAALVAANFNAFGIGVLKHLAAQSRGQNVFISPTSIGIALSMVADGTAAGTRAQILRALQSGSDPGAQCAALIAALRSSPDAKIGIADALWTRADIAPNPAYSARMRRQYGAAVQALRFGDPSAAQTINDWTRRNTLGLIDRLVDETSPGDFVYLTNALAFQGKWTLPFKHGATSPQRFTPATGKPHDVPMMHQTAAFETGNFAGVRALRMPYGKGGFAAYVLLPDGNGTAPLLAHLDARSFARIAGGLHEERLEVALPRFTARYHASLNAALQQLGMGGAFLFSANFTPLHAPPPRLRLSKVDHATYLRVDEEGTVAAAATSAGITMTAILENPAKPFVVDHPFVFAIRDERSGNLLFIGLINDVPGAAK